MRCTRRLILLALFTALTWQSQAVAVTTYDLKADWSETANPNGPWSYNEGNNPLPHVDWWQRNNVAGGGFTTAQPGWAEVEDGVGRIPVWLQTNGTNTLMTDSQPGDIIVHTLDPFNGGGNGEANVTWTSPGNGSVDLSGGVWSVNFLGRSNHWALFHNGNLLSGGDVIDGGSATRANPFLLANGSGGASVLDDIPVAAGDVFAMFLTRNGSDGDFVGVNLTVDFTAVPEPTGVALSAIGVLALSMPRLLGSRTQRTATRQCVR